MKDHIVGRLTIQTFDDSSSHCPLPVPSPPPTRREGPPVGLAGSASRHTGVDFVNFLHSNRVSTSLAY